MDRTTELQLIDELLAIKAGRTFYLDEEVTRNPVSHYVSEERFNLEREKLFRQVPLIAAHSSELAEPGSFLRRDIAGLPVLLTRDRQGGANAFLNVCRHRGTQLVEADSGCQHKFTCPYHAWTYSSAGKLLAAPHFKEGFTGEEKSDYGLKRLTCEERHGFIWVRAEGEGPADVEGFLGGLSPELDALQIDDMFVASNETIEVEANWKLIVEGGIEAYHFKVAHRETIGPHFEDNLSTYRMFGDHMRSILMRSSMARLDPDTRDEWRLRDHAQVLYNLLPTSSLLVQQDHIASIHSEPLGPSTTRLRLVTLAPKADAHKTDHWAQNHTITKTTLMEDFVLNASMQKGLASGAIDHMTFGRFEGALDAYNNVVESYLEGPPPMAEAVG
jgi:phenylpropionate dioxygenase-like ring-hydroxylating dioxygenase large terminal subunit